VAVGKSGLFRLLDVINLIAHNATSTATVMLMNSINQRRLSRPYTTRFQRMSTSSRQSTAKIRQGTNATWNYRKPPCLGRTSIVRYFSSLRANCGILRSEMVNTDKRKKDCSSP